MSYRCNTTELAEAVRLKIAMMRAEEDAMAEMLSQPIKQGPPYFASGIERMIQRCPSDYQSELREHEAFVGWHNNYRNSFTDSPAFHVTEGAD